MIVFELHSLILTAGPRRQLVLRHVQVQRPQSLVRQELVK